MIGVMTCSSSGSSGLPRNPSGSGAKGDARSALTRAVTDAINAIEELRSGLEQAEQAVSFGFVRGEFTARSGV